MSLPWDKETSLGLSTSACEMLLVLKDHILEVGEMISKPLFTSFWQRLAGKINRFLFEEVCFLIVVLLFGSYINLAKVWALSTVYRLGGLPRYRLPTAYCMQYQVAVSFSGSATFLC